MIRNSNKPGCVNVSKAVVWVQENGGDILLDNGADSGQESET